MSYKVLHENQLTKRVAVIMGTRPGIIKMAPIVRSLTDRKIENYIIHTGQHYSDNMDSAFFRSLNLPQPKYRVDETRHCVSHGAQTAEMMIGVEKALLDLKPKVVLVCGDANTNLAAGLAARKLGMIVGHVESGLRSNDWSMPEEHNRIILDHICELLFAPTEENVKNLINDNVRGAIHLTGNTIVDATLHGVAIGEKIVNLLEDYRLIKNQYVLFTSHREENVDIQQKLQNIITGVRGIIDRTNMKVLFPIHPRTRKMIDKFGMTDMLKDMSNIVIADPLGYFETLVLIKNAALVLTDSGGLQEEACILQTPCVTLRENTERPETVKVGCNMIAGTNPEQIVDMSVRMLSIKRKWSIPFGDGKAAIKIADIIEKTLIQDVFLANISKQTRAELESSH